jgi:predicted transcriptional regulator
MSVVTLSPEEVPVAKVGELEALVMRHVWDAQEAVTVRGVLEALPPDKPLAYTTVMTVMERLYRKGLLVREESGKAYLYAAAVSRADYTARMMTDVLHEGGDSRAALVHFAGRLSARERAALRKALAPEQPSSARP